MNDWRDFDYRGCPITSWGEDYCRRVAMKYRMYYLVQVPKYPVTLGYTYYVLAAMPIGCSGSWRPFCLFPKPGRAMISHNNHASFMKALKEWASLRRKDDSVPEERLLELIATAEAFPKVNQYPDNPSEEGYSRLRLLMKPEKEEK